MEAQAAAVKAARQRVNDAIELLHKASQIHSAARSHEERMTAQDAMIIANMTMNRALIDMNMAHHDYAMSAMDRLMEVLAQ